MFFSDFCQYLPVFATHPAQDASQQRTALIPDAEDGDER